MMVSGMMEIESEMRDERMVEIESEMRFKGWCGCGLRGRLRLVCGRGAGHKKVGIAVRVRV